MNNDTVAIRLTAISDAAEIIGRETSRINSSLKDLQSNQDSARKNTQSNTDMMKFAWDAFAVATGISIAGLISSVRNMAGELIQSAANFERFGIAAQFLTGSQQEADKFAIAMRRIGLESGFSVEEVSKIGVMMLGANKSVEKTVKWLDSLTNSVAATNGGIMQLEGAGRAMIQMFAKPIASSEEFNRQFSNTGIPVARKVAESVEKDLNHPLRKYLVAATGAGGATKSLTKDYTKANEVLSDQGWKLRELEDKLRRVKDAHGEGSWEVDKSRAALEKYKTTITQAQDTISKFNSAQSKIVTAPKLTADDIMGQLQNLGDLKVPGELMAETVERALSESFGGANAVIVKTFSGQLQQVQEKAKMVGLELMGIGENSRVKEGSIFAMLSEHLREFNNELEKFTKTTTPIGKELNLWFGTLKNVFGMVGIVITSLNNLGKSLGLNGFFNKFIQDLRVAINLLIWVFDGVALIFNSIAYSVTLARLKINEFFGWGGNNAKLNQELERIEMNILDIGVNAEEAYFRISGFTDKNIEQIRQMSDSALPELQQQNNNMMSVYKGTLQQMQTDTLTASNNITNTHKTMYSTLVTDSTVSNNVLKTNSSSMSASIQQDFLLMKDQTGVNLLRMTDTVAGQSAQMKTHVEENMSQMPIMSQKHSLKMMSNFKESVESKTPEINAVIQKLESGIDAKLNESASKGRDHGKNLIEQMIQGIKDSINNLKKTSVGKWIFDRLNIPQFEHGGIIPGNLGSPVPIIAHAGERVIPRTGVDVNSGAMSGNININFNGSLTVDSEARVHSLAQEVVRVLGRQNELARYGAGF